MNLAEKNIVVVSATFFLPTDNGKKVVLSGVAKYFLEKFGPGRVTWLLVDDKKFTPVAGIDVIRIEGQTKIQKVLSVLGSFFGQGYSLQEGLFRSDILRKKVSKIIDEINPDILFVDTVRMAFLISESSCASKKILYLEDLFSVRYSLILDQMRLGSYDGRAVLGGFAEKLPKAASHLIQRYEWLRRLILKREYRLIRRSENKTSMQFDSALLINSGEVLELKDRGVPHVREIPPYLDLEFSYHREGREKKDFVFLGALNIPHNEAGLLFFIENCLPLILRKVPGFRLKIIGRHATPRLINAISSHLNSLELSGFLPDLNEEFYSCQGMIVPLIFGSGVKLKSLEALARGVPLISTKYGVEGINVVAGNDFLLVDKPEDYAAAIIQLMDADSNSRMSLSAYNFFKRNYSRAVVFEKYDKLF